MPDTLWINSCDSHHDGPEDWDAGARLADLDREGIWAEVVFPPAITWSPEDDDPRRVRAEVSSRNEWLAAEVQKPAPDRLVPVATLPMTSVEDAVAELRRAAELGLHCAQMPTAAPAGLRTLNRDEWKPLWATAAETGTVLAFHVGDRPELQVYGGTKGGALLDHCEGAYEAWLVGTTLVSCGALDQNPGLRVLIAAAGSSWVPFIGDRMDEGYRQHSEFTRPRLSAEPKELLYRQVYTSFQYEPTAPEAVTAMGYRNACFGRHHVAGDTQATVHELLGGLEPEVRDRIAEGAFRELFPHISAVPSGASSAA